MKSLLVTTESFTVGGLETHIAGEVACLVEEGFRVHLAVGANASDKMLPKEVASVSLGMAMEPATTTAELIQTVEALRKIIREQTVECVHAHPFMSLVPSMIAAELEGIPFVVTLHGPSSMSGVYGPLYDFLLTSVILPKADMVVAVSREVADLAAPYVDAARLCVLPNGVPLEKFRAGEVDDYADERWLLVGRLDAQKIVGMRDFIQKSATAGLPGILLAGDGGAREHLQSQLDSDGLSDFVEFLGATDDVPRLMRRAAGVAGMGRVVLEGLASDRPVVLVGYDGVKGLVTPVTFKAAAASNFSGRGMPNIDAPEFSRQLSLTQRGAAELTQQLNDEYSDKTVWRKFAQNIRNLKTSGRSLLSDTYVRLVSEQDHSLTEAYLNSQSYLEQIARLVHSPRHFEQSAAANFNYSRNRHIEAIQIAKLNQTIVERDGQIAGLNQALAEREGQIAGLNQAVAEREGQIASLNQAVAELHTQLMAMSNIDKHPLKHATKKAALGFARSTLRALPLSATTKRKLRDIFYSTIRTLRQPAPTTPPSETAPPEAQNSSAGIGRDVFVFAVIDWHFRIQRPQHIARSLTEQGHRVFYFSNHFVDASAPGYQIEKIPGTDELYQIKLHVKGAPEIYFNPPSDAALTMLTKSVAKLIRDFNALSSISIVQHAYWYPLVKRLPNSYRVYDCMDHHEGFGNVPAKLIDIEKEMLCGCDIVTVTSSWLEDFARSYNQNVALVRNAAEYSHFVTRPEDVFKDDNGRRIIGYYGAIAEWFDIDLVRTIARAYPDCLILLVGNDTIEAQKALADLANVKFTGEVPYAALPFYLHAFDVCLLPFKVTPLTLATNPVKVYEYLAAGKPVVCVDLPEVGQFGNLVSRASSTDDFVALVGASLQESGVLAEQKSAERRRFASEQTWSHRGAELATALKTIQMPRVSVIILTFNNLDLTQACLNSVLECSDYPNLEIIVVDNASSDGTPEYLEDLSLRHQNVRIVLNQENLGFAAGNNAGLSVATGDYMVLLNNDTVVTQGWVMTLLRHFQVNPHLGLLGPVTNNIGNEARIETRYTDIAHMPAEALSYTLAHMGELYSMQNAAFFCAMFPRSTYERCGPISEEYGRGFFEDDDYCRKVHSAGLSIACADDVFVHHHLSASFNKLKEAERRALFEQNKAIYEKKWGPWTPHVHRR